ncbi:MAG: 3-isopropylmalate dehydratase small subunit [Acidimicrobiia bacterium]|nr:3-isopropylmalate dehydratase small subunit [Acidimicrobiia bacterium]MYC58416.1 3-isopropylmalate dehydratase small subunit [Acidimicrobiia bacterium]MYG94175.1 3-isopropylmalate dehydratase small subunit [Acidimicrobiia bacterium]MYI30478.1 3-isopropylmalate dehydratase small subunit [Acidimicrobiia bacterium]
MKPVQIITGKGLPLNRSDVDTDQIIPSDWLKRVERTGFERGLFSEWREDPDFVLNDPRYSEARILVAGPNFGTGSSREHAVWAIQQYGFEAVISPRFGDIFHNNAAKNGLIPVQVDLATVNQLWDTLANNPAIEITINVERCTLAVPAIKVSTIFPLDRSVQKRLLEGLDDISLTLAHTPAIDNFEATRAAWLPSVI